VGYAGGTRPNPTYRSLGDHTETLRVEFDPAAVSYEELLEVFWESHDPTARAYSRQYRAVVFYHGEEQKRLAEASRGRVAARLSSPIRTEVLPAGPFTPAEDYHQKYYLRNSGELMEEFKRLFPDPKGFARSTAAARANGYLGRHADADTVRRALPSLGLSPRGQALLADKVFGRGFAASCGLGTAAPAAP
jgi:peptide-methionine (S)-S-oxide reductase